MENNIIVIDKYTKAILTIIAFMLLAIVVKLYFSPEEVIAKSSVMDVNVKYIDGRNISNGIISVNLEQMDGRSVSANLPVNIQSIDGQNLSRGIVPVDIRNINNNSISGSELPVKIAR